jgi:hypothetical protein
MANKRYVFNSRWLGYTVWNGRQKIKFSKGRYETNDPSVAAFLRKDKECKEVEEPEKKAAEPEPKSKTSSKK